MLCQLKSKLSFLLTNHGLKGKRENMNQLIHSLFLVLALFSYRKDNIINPPENDEIVANPIPFAWPAYFEGGHAFMYQRFADLSFCF